MSLVLLPALADPFEEFLLVLFHQPDEGLVFRFLVPPGPQHHYTFVLIATDLEPGALQPGLTREDLPKALDGHVKGSTGIIATFAKP